jgi:hypothetical protein
MLIPLQSRPIHRNRRSKPFEGFWYALYDAKGLRISQYENGEEEEENGDNGDIDVEMGMEEE